ncbi:MAG TPA: hypothetical protein PLN27_07765, partial [Acidobacteriota bacterium]|nr:hypothetical protein [Acidobacteriota bacterium]HQK87793.1 hypothetical protein [Acidobacteriota bacterium]
MLAEYAPDPDGPPDPIDPTAPDGLLKARQYLYGPALLAAESFDPSPEPPAPSLVFYHLDPLGSTVNLTAGANVPGDGKEYLASGTAVLSGSVATASTAGVLADPIPGAVTAAYLYDAWGNYRELDLSNPAAPDKL